MEFNKLFGQRIRFFFRLSVTLILLSIIVWIMGGVEDLFNTLSQAKPVYILLAFLISSVDRALMTFKWSILLRSQGEHLPFLQGMRIYCASMIWGILLPSTLGADVIRVYNTSHMGIDSDITVVSIVIERMIGFLSALILGLISFILLSFITQFDSRFDGFLWFGGVILVFVTVAFSTTFSQVTFDFLHKKLLLKFWDKNIMKRLRKIHSAYMAFKGKKIILALFFILTFSEQLLPILFAWLIAYAFGVKVGILFVAGAIPLSLLISRLPISIDGLGVFDSIFIFLMALGGVSVSESIAIAFGGRIVQIISWLPWWISFTIGNPSFKPSQVIVKQS